jgi:hypothetical protein
VEEGFHMGFCLKAKGLHLEKTPPPCEGWGYGRRINPNV